MRSGILMSFEYYKNQYIYLMNTATTCILFHVKTQPLNEELYKHTRCVRKA